MADPDHGVGPGPEASVDVLLGLCDGHVGLLLGADRDGDVDALVGVLDADVVHPGVVADPAGPAIMPEHGADRVGVEHHASRASRALREHLHVRRRRPVGRDHQLDDARTGRAGDGFEHVGTRSRASERAKALTRPIGQARRRWRAPRRSGAGRRRRHRRPSRRRWSRGPSCARSPARPARGARSGTAAASGRARSGVRRVARAPARPPPRARLTSTRFDVTPISMLARKPERSSPSTVVKPSLDVPAR